MFDARAKRMRDRADWKKWSWKKYDVQTDSGTDRSGRRIDTGNGKAGRETWQAGQRKDRSRTGRFRIQRLSDDQGYHSDNGSDLPQI